MKELFSLELKYIGFYFFVFTLALPLPLIISSFAMGFLILNSIYLSKKSKFKFDIFILFSALFFFIDVITLFLADNRGFENNMMFSETKITFLVLPLFFANISEDLYKIKNQLYFIFVLGVLTYVIYAWLFLIFNIIIFNVKINQYILIELLQKELPGSYHHTYIGSYMVFSCVLLFFNLIENNKSLNKRIIITYFFLFVSLVYIGSKLSILLLILFSSMILLFSNLSIKKSLSVISIFIFLMGLLIFSIKDYIIYRLVDQSFAHRLLYFSKSWSIIKENLFFGIGSESIKKIFFPIGDNSVRLIPHNVFLRETLSNGIFGLVIISTIFIILIYRSIVFRDQKLLFFSLLILSYCMIEDYIYLQRGVLFFIFFSSIMYYTTNYEKNQGVG
ncbi:O-antigen ligase family protein [Joostella sp. CR20]|uniref:O-antigen ligase family protein n=1 Tax=Joostella sp. CR20 TaxID=2804312 RepID=UPI00313DD600